MPGLRILRSPCEERLNGIPVPQPFRMDEFAAALAASRRRRLVVRELPAAARGVMTGAWVATRQADIVFVEPTASRWHQDLIFLHEAGHMLCDHQADATWDLDHLASMLPDITPGTPRGSGHRGGRSRPWPSRSPWTCQPSRPASTAWLGSPSSPCCSSTLP